MAFIEIKSLSKSYNDSLILKEINLDVEQGEILALVGPTGSGKTTLLRHIDLLEEPTKGSITFDGIEVSALGEGELLRIRRRMAMVFQKPTVFRGTVYHNVNYGLRVRGLKDGGKVEEALRSVGLLGCNNRDATTLSGGEMQRLALARAMVVEPDLLLLDEPTSNLDPKSVEVIEDLVKLLAGRGTTVIMATHNMIQCRKLAKRVAVLVDGRINTIGRPEDLLTWLSLGDGQTLGTLAPW
jgi:tungstate transport system ATP-binding protein